MYWKQCIFLNKLCVRLNVQWIDWKEVNIITNIFPSKHLNISQHNISQHGYKFSNLNYLNLLLIYSKLFPLNEILEWNLLTKL